MTKALLGHVGVPNQRVIAELHRLGQRVSDLEAALARLKDQHREAALSASNGGPSGE